MAGQVFRISLVLFIINRHPSTNLELNFETPDSLNTLLITFYTLMQNTKCKSLCFFGFFASNTLVSIHDTNHFKLQSNYLLL